jgi:hypothetical protein
VISRKLWELGFSSFDKVDHLKYYSAGQMWDCLGASMLLQLVLLSDNDHFLIREASTSDLRKVPYPFNLQEAFHFGQSFGWQTKCRVCSCHSYETKKVIIFGKKETSSVSPSKSYEVPYQLKSHSTTWLATT